VILCRRGLRWVNVSGIHYSGDSRLPEIQFLLQRLWFVQHESKIQKAPVEDESLS
jgi:hypothetical protein